jgi:hypothetical protein
MANSRLAGVRIFISRMSRIVTVVIALAPGLLRAQQQAPPAPVGPPGPQQESQQGPQQSEPGADPHAAEELAAQRQALGFLGYLDHGRYADSYSYTGMLIRNQLDREAFASKVEQARANAGALQSRELVDAGYTTSVPGAPEGQYVVLHYHSSFAKRPDTLETLTLALAKGYWRVDGWFIK